MPAVELIMPKMGESIMEATILNWLKNVGDTVEVDEAVLEIATDKVDSEVPSPVAGVISEILFEENDVVEVGKAIAIINTDGDAAPVETPKQAAEPVVEKVETPAPAPVANPTPAPEPVAAQPASQPAPAATATLTAPIEGRFYSPLVLNIARNEGISMVELEQLPGTGKEGRVTKKDILNYVQQRTNGNGSSTNTTANVVNPAPAATPQPVSQPAAAKPAAPAPKAAPAPVTSNDGNTEVVEMDRMRKLIADHMVRSKQTSPHVTSFVEADVTNVVNWRNKVKKQFQQQHGEKITFTPIFMEAVAKAIKDFPGVNASVDGDKIIIKKDINLGMAAALPSGNLIVPVVKNADHLSLLGITKAVNSLTAKARANKLSPSDIQDGTYTVSNVGTFGNVMGTPIINQPQVAILAVGAIRKKPVVLETPEGDVIGIRHMMFLSHSYDHRVVDGMLGGSFVKRVADYLENFDVNREI